MFKNTTIALVIILISITFIQNASGQVFTKNTLKLGFGVGVSMGQNTDGLGMNYSIGYQRELWMDRVRFNPNFSIGNYSSKHVMDARDQYFNSCNYSALLLKALLTACCSYNSRSDCKITLFMMFLCLKSERYFGSLQRNRSAKQNHY